MAARKTVKKNVSKLFKSETFKALRNSVSATSIGAATR